MLDDDHIMEYEIASGSNGGGMISGNRPLLQDRKPAFQVIHDVDRPKSQSLCLTKAPPQMAEPVQTVLEDVPLPDRETDPDFYLESCSRYLGKIW